jgi:hypothetical protein
MTPPAFPGEHLSSICPNIDGTASQAGTGMCAAPISGGYGKLNSLSAADSGISLRDI